MGELLVSGRVVDKQKAKTGHRHVLLFKSCFCFFSGNGETYNKLSGDTTMKQQHPLPPPPRRRRRRIRIVIISDSYTKKKNNIISFSKTTKQLRATWLATSCQWETVTPRRVGERGYSKFSPMVGW